MRRYERATGAAQSTERLVSQTKTDSLGRLVESAGAGVVEEFHTYALQGNGNTRETVIRGLSNNTAQ